MSEQPRVSHSISSLLPTEVEGLDSLNGSGYSAIHLDGSSTTTSESRQLICNLGRSPGGSVFGFDGLYLEAS